MNKDKKDKPKKEVVGLPILSPGAEIIIYSQGGAKTNTRDTLKSLLCFSLLTDICFTQLNDEKPSWEVTYEIIEFNVSENLIRVKEIKRRRPRKAKS